MAMITWRKQLTQCLTENNESLEDIEAISMASIDYNDDDSEEKSIRKLFPEEIEVELDRKFDGGFGGVEGAPFWAWTKKNVYFCSCYDGSEWISSVPRNPNDVGNRFPSHIGGG